MGKKHRLEIDGRTISSGLDPKAPAATEERGEPEKPTIAELEAIMEEDDLELTILPNGEVRTQKRPTVHALEDMVERGELPARLKKHHCPTCGAFPVNLPEDPLPDVT